MDNQKQMNNRADDEIDLSYFFSKIGRFFGGIKRQGKRGGEAIYRNWLTMLWFVLLGAALGFGAYLLTRTYYTSSMTVVLAELRNDLVEDLVKNLDVMVKEKNAQSLSKQLNISPVAAKQIKSIKFSNVDQARTNKDSILIGGPFVVTLSLYNNQYFDTLETGILHYLESNQYFTRNKVAKREYMEMVISKLEKDIASIDSIRELAITPRGPVNSFVYGEALDPTDLYKEGVNLMEKKAKLQTDLRLIDNIQVVAGFAPRRLPTGPNLLVYLLIGSGVLFLIGFLVISSRESKKQAAFQNA